MSQQQEKLMHAADDFAAVFLGLMDVPPEKAAAAAEQFPAALRTLLAEIINAVSAQSASTFNVAYQRANEAHARIDNLERKVGGDDPAG